MRVDDFLAHVNDVNASGSGGGWIARCPAHDDGRPSLAVKEGSEAVLVKCWAGCSVDDVCRSLGLHVKNLFYDDGQPRDGQEVRQRRMERQQQATDAAAALASDAASIDACKEADRVLARLSRYDPSSLSDEMLHAVIGRACDAQTVLMEEERGET